MNKVISSFYKHRVTILIVLTLQILATNYLTNTYLSSRNTLYNNGHWKSTKTTLERGVMGAYKFILSRQALSKNRLNLAAWHGFQEVIHYQKFSAKEIDFDFLLGDNAYFIFIFNKDNDGFCGIRLSNHERFDSIFLTASNIGKFLSKSQIEIRKLREKKWRHMKIRFKKDSFSLFINNKFIESLEIPILNEQFIGFRGSRNAVFIDNILVRGEGRKVLLKENFTNRKNYFLILTLITLIIGFINILILVIQILRKSTYRETIFTIIGFNATILLLSFIFLHIYNYYSARYTKVTSTLKAQEEYWENANKEFILDKIKNKYNRMPLNTYRILFIGTSQTWGAGATRNNETFVHIVEKKLNEFNNNNIHYECINGGVSGVNSKELFHIYKDEWITLNLKLVIINLSNNDFNKAIFSKYLKQFVVLNRSKGIRTVFILESNSIERRPHSLPSHSVMRKIGKKYKIPVINLHKYLLDNYDEGFLWWDYVHLTSFGHDLAGNFLTDEILKIID